jgi:hypothetical protein
MLGKAHRGGAKEKQPCHTEFCREKSIFSVPRKRDDHCFAPTLHGLNPAAAIPRNPIAALSDDIRPADPTILNSRSEDPSAELLGRDFGLWKLWHVEQSLLIRMDRLHRQSKSDLPHRPLRHEHYAKATEADCSISTLCGA